MRRSGLGNGSPMWVVLAVVAVLWIISLIVESGVLPWAIASGMVTAGVALWISREWRLAVGTGATVVVTIVVLGVMATASPGWYRL